MYNNATTLLGRKYINNKKDLEEIYKDIPDTFLVIAVLDCCGAKISHGFIKLPDEVPNQQTLCSAVNATLEEDQVIICNLNSSWIFFHFTSNLVFVSNDIEDLEIF